MIANSSGPVTDDEGPDRLKVVRLVKELRALSAGTDSPAEAASAAAKAQSLLLKHNLSMSEVESLDDADRDPLVELKESFSSGRRRIDSWRRMLVHAVAESCLCEWVTSFYQEPGERTFSFIGRQSNVEVAVYSYRCLERQVIEIGEAEKLRRRAEGIPVRRFLSHFFEGVVDSIRQRLARDRTRFEEADPQSRAVVEARGREAELHRKDLYPHVTFHSRTHRVDAHSRAAGQRAGQGVQLNHALGSEAKPRKLLGG